MNIILAVGYHVRSLIYFVRFRRPLFRGLYREIFVLTVVSILLYFPVRNALSAFQLSLLRRVVPRFLLPPRIVQRALRWTQTRLVIRIFLRPFTHKWRSRVLEVVERYENLTVFQSIPTNREQSQNPTDNQAKGHGPSDNLTKDEDEFIKPDTEHRYPASLKEKASEATERRSSPKQYIPISKKDWQRKWRHDVDIFWHLQIVPFFTKLAATLIVALPFGLPLYLWWEGGIRARRRLWRLSKLDRGRSRQEREAFVRDTWRELRLFSIFQLLLESVPFLQVFCLLLVEATSALWMVDVVKFRCLKDVRWMDRLPEIESFGLESFSTSAVDTGAIDGAKLRPLTPTEQRSMDRTHTSDTNGLTPPDEEIRSDSPTTTLSSTEAGQTNETTLKRIRSPAEKVNNNVAISA